jgi:hypothetical protein
MTFPGRRSSPHDPKPSTVRPLRGGPIPVSEADLPFYAAIVGRPPTADDRTAVFVSEFNLPDEEPAANAGAWHRAVARVRRVLASLKRAG